MVAPNYARRPGQNLPTFVVQISLGGDAAELTRVFTSSRKARARAVRCADILRGRAWRKPCEVRVIYKNPADQQVVFRVPVWVPGCERRVG
jgi:hypothetical protein